MNYKAVFDEQSSMEYRILYSLRKRSVLRFQKALRDPKMTQEIRFSKIIRLLTGTKFSAEHGYDSTCSMHEFREKVPIRQYDELKAWLTPHQNGETKIITRARVSSFVETSGTTSKAKLIPVTKGWAKTISEAQGIWALSLVHDHPTAALGKALTMVSPAEHSKTKGGISIGSNTGRMHQAQPWWIRRRYPIPPEVFGISPSAVKQYVYLRFALQENISSWTTANPSMLLLLCSRLHEWKGFLSKDLVNGTLRCGPAELLDVKDRKTLEKKLRATAPPFDWRPAKIWPLAVVNCWKGGPASYFLSRLPSALGADIPIREVGITASEGYFALPLGSNWNGGVLWTQGHILEFVDEHNQCFWSWEIELGKQYRLVITTETGLIRYDLNDIIEVVGFCHQTPVVRFVGKAGRFLNSVGEKLSEEQLSLAVREACIQTSSNLVGFTARILWSTTPSIQFAYEGRISSGFSIELERALCKRNIEYASKRESGRMQPISIISLSKNTYTHFRSSKIKQGAPAGQIKDPILAVNDEEWERVISSSNCLE